MVISVYVKDAPFKKLPLIAKGLIHDWNWLLSGNLEIAEPLGDGIFIIGILVWISSIIIGFIFAIRDFRWYQEHALPE
ncbi:MAG: hypothetical protein QME52_04755 [Bacteroidota bacterium]|nr:hypothetical protein [Bacteroidota bacterium]